MARKWSNRNLPGALHFVTACSLNRIPVFNREECCTAFLDICSSLRQEWPFKLIAYVLMPDHFHLIANPRDGRIKELAGAIKSRSAQAMVRLAGPNRFLGPDPSTHQVWQESFKGFPLWSDWLISQKINYIHSNPVKARLVRSAAEYHWSSFRAYYLGEREPIEIDRDWWWPDDLRKLSVAAAGWAEEIKAKGRKR